MNSPNINHIPKNRDGALELGMSPCNFCFSGYINFCSSINGRFESCFDNCEYWKIFNDKEEMELIRLRS